MSDPSPSRAPSTALSASAVLLSLVAIAASVYAAVAIGSSALVLLVDAPFDGTGESARMLGAAFCAVVVPPPMGIAALGLAVAKRPLPAIVLALLAIALGGGVGYSISSYFRHDEAPAVDASALGRACPPAECPTGYQCVGTIATGNHCEIPCDDSTRCPAGTTCMFVDVIGQHCR